jgi:hypothetical protein
MKPYDNINFILVNTPKVVLLGGKFFEKFVQLKMYEAVLVVHKGREKFL